MVKSLRAGHLAPPTVFEASGCCYTNSLHERKKKVQSTKGNRVFKKNSVSVAR